MSIRKQVIIAMALVTLIVSTVLSLLLYMVISSGFNRLENNIVQQNIERVHNGLDNYFNAFKAKSGDWAHWDASYNFVDTLDEQYIRENIITDAFFTLEMNVLVYYNRDLKLVYKSAVDLENRKFMDVPDDAIQQFSHVVNKQLMEGEKPLTSYIQVPGKPPMMFVAYPILRSDGSGPANGIVVFGRYLDTDLIHRLEKSTLFPLELETINGNLSKDFSEAEKYLEKQVNGPNIFITTDSKESHGYTMIHDIFNNPAYLIKVSIPHELQQEGNRTILYVIITVMLAGLIFGITVYAHIERTVLVRLYELSKGINRISTSQYKKVGLYVNGNDEIGKLAKEIEKMVLNLYTIQMDLQRSGERYKGVVESQIDLIIRKDRNNRVVFVNDAYCKKFGLNKEHIIGKVFEVAPEHNKKDLSFETMVEKLMVPPYRISLEQEVKVKKGWCWIAWEYAAIRNKQGEIIEIQGVGRDITILKKNEKTLKDRAEELEKLNHLMIGREIKMAELKEEIKKLQTKKI